MMHIGKHTFKNLDAFLNHHGITSEDGKRLFELHRLRYMEKDNYPSETDVYLLHLSVTATLMQLACN